MTSGLTIAVYFLVGATSIYGITLEEKNNICDQLVKGPSFVHEFDKQIKKESGCTGLYCNNDYLTFVVRTRAPVIYGQAHFFRTLDCKNTKTVPEDIAMQCDKLRYVTAKIAQNLQLFPMKNAVKIMDQFAIAYKQHAETLMKRIGCQ